MLPLLSVSAGWMLLAQTFALEKPKILEAREQGISSGYCKFTVQGLNTHVPSNSRYNRLYEVWFSGSRIREDVNHRDGPLAGQRQISCVGCEKNDLFLGSFVTKSRSLMLEKIKGEVPPELRPSDPRKLGYVLNDYFGFRHTRLDGLFSLPGMAEPTRSSVKLDGLDCLKFTWGECSNGWKPTLWTSPSQGNNIVRIEVVSPNFEGFVRSELTKDPASGIWFPKKTHFEMKEGGVLTRQETIQVEKVLFNAPEIEEAFYLDNMALPEGTLVNFPTGMGDAIIQNGKLSREGRTTLRNENRPKPPVPVREVSGPSWVPYGILSGIMLLLTGVVLFWRKNTLAH